MEDTRYLHQPESTTRIWSSNLSVQQRCDQVVTTIPRLGWTSERFGNPSCEARVLPLDAFGNSSTPHPATVVRQSTQYVEQLRPLQQKNTVGGHSSLAVGESVSSEAEVTTQRVLRSHTRMVRTAAKANAGTTTKDQSPVPPSFSNHPHLASHSRERSPGSLQRRPMCDRGGANRGSSPEPLRRNINNINKCNTKNSNNTDNNNANNHCNTNYHNYHHNHIANPTSTDYDQHPNENKDITDNNNNRSKYQNNYSLPSFAPDDLLHDINSKKRKSETFLNTPTTFYSSTNETTSCTATSDANVLGNNNSSNKARRIESPCDAERTQVIIPTPIYPKPTNAQLKQRTVPVAHPPFSPPHDPTALITTTTIMDNAIKSSVTTTTTTYASSEENGNDTFAKPETPQSIGHFLRQRAKQPVKKRKASQYGNKVKFNTRSKGAFFDPQEPSGSPRYMWAYWDLHGGGPDVHPDLTGELSFPDKEGGNCNKIQQNTLAS